MKLEFSDEQIKQEIIPIIIALFRAEINTQILEMKWDVRKELKEEILKQYLSGWSKELNNTYKEEILRLVKEQLDSSVKEQLQKYIDSEKKNIDYIIARNIDEKANKVLADFIFVHKSSLP